MQKIAMGIDSKSDELIDGDVLNYPIALYSQINARLMLLLISMIPIMLGLFMLFMANVEQRWILFNVGCVFLFLGMIGCLIAIKNKKSKRPILVIDESGLSVAHYYSFKKPQTYRWEYLKSIELKRFKNTHKSRWVLEIQPKAGRVIELPLPILYLENMLLSQEEAYYLIEQAYSKQSPVYKKIDKQEERPAKFNRQDIEVIGIFIAIFLSQFIIQLFIK